MLVVWKQLMKERKGRCFTMLWPVLCRATVSPSRASRVFLKHIHLEFLFSGHCETSRSPIDISLCHLILTHGAPEVQLQWPSTHRLQLPPHCEHTRRRGRYELKYFLST